MRTQAPEPQITIPAPPLPPVLLSSRLVVTGILAAGLALLTVVLALTGLDYWSTRQSMLQDSRVEAAIVADNIAAAVMFRDARTANEMLERMALENGHFSERLQSDEVKAAITAFFMSALRR